MAAKTGITLIKQFTYRGDASEEFSNTYHFTGSVPSDNTAWKAFSDALIAQEKTLYMPAAKVVRAYGYDTDNPADDSVWSYDYLAAAATVPGTLSPTAHYVTSGDQAAWIRWKTSRLNSKGKPIYLRKYFHVVACDTNTLNPTDAMSTAWKTAAAAFATKMHDGTFDSGRLITAQEHDDTILSTAYSLYVTTRTLKRRGKRPGS